MKLSKKQISITVVILAVIAFAAWRFWGKSPVNKVVFENTTVQLGTIHSSITATGSIEPITQVEVGTQVSGIIDRIYVDYNSVVKKGQLLAELDKTNLENSLRSAGSNMSTAKTEYEYQQKNYNRIQGLHEKELISTAEYDQAYYSYQKAVNDYNVSKNEYDKAQTNLGYATIYSPIDGVVLSKEVEEGQTVAASMSTPTLFTIAQDLKQMQVVADVDEADIGNIRDGQRVSFTVDAYPEDVFEGEVTQVRQEATVTNNVVTYEVIIKAPNEDLKLKPGLTANVTIYTLEKMDILTVPSKALRFYPDEALIGKDDEVEKAENIRIDETHKILWTQEGNIFRAIPVEIGITNGTLTEIVSGISEGTRVVLDATAAAGNGSDDMANGNGSQERSPFMPGPPNRNSKK